MKRLLPLVLAGASSLLSACTATPKNESPAPAATALSLADPRAMTIIRGDGSPASWADLVAACADAEAALFGEVHGHPDGLHAAATLWADVTATGRPAALCLEFIERDQQVHLEDFSAGITDEPALRTAARLTDGNFPEGHAAMVRTAKERSLPVVAANAPRRYVRLSRLEGYDRLNALSPAQKALFRIPVGSPDSEYRLRFDRVMQAMKQPAAGGADTPADAPAPPVQPDPSLDAMFRAQQLWDWTMADSVVAQVESGRRPTVLVVGQFHTDHAGGLVQALKALRPQTRTLTVSFVSTKPPADGLLASQDRNRADFLVFTGPIRTTPAGSAARPAARRSR